MISSPMVRSLSFQALFLAGLILASAGFLMPHTAHALPPDGAEIDDGEGWDDGSGGGGEPTPPPAATVSLAATPSSVQQSYASQLSYNSSSVTSCSINNNVGSVTANSSGYKSVSPSSTTTYTITCQASAGGTVTATATVTVTAAPTPLTAYCEAGPDTAQINETVQWSTTHSSGSTSNLAWKRGTSFTTKICTGGQNYSEPNSTCPEFLNEGAACSVEGQRCKESSGCDGSTYTDGEGQNNAHTTYGSVTPYTCVATNTSATYTYAWTGTDGLTGSTQNVSKAYTTTGVKTGRATVTRSTGGSASATCTASIGPKEPTATINANPASIQSGSSSTLTWSSTNATACTLDMGIGSVATSGTRSVSPSSTAVYTLTCTAPGTDAATAAATVTVTAAPTFPDLTAGNISPTTATAGSAQIFSATVSNIGTANAGVSATRFQRATSAAGAGAATISDVSTAAIAAGGNLARSAPYTFSSAGTYYVRACADTGVAVAESNEGNNCGAWTAITVSTAVSPTVSCTVSPSSVVLGGSVTYSANPAGGASTPFTWTASDGASVGTGTTATRTFSTPGTYAMNVRASGTAVSYCPNVSVTANWCTASTPNLTITATPARVRSGQSVALAWSASGVNGQNATCTVSGPGVSWNSAVSVSPSCSASGSANTTISTQSTYTLTCNGVSESVTVNVIPNFQEF